MKSYRLSLTIFSALLWATSLRAQPDRIIEPINPGLSIELAGSVPFDAQSQPDQGPVQSSYPLNAIILALKPSHQQQAQLSQLLVDLQNPASKNYHRWLTAAQYADRFGLSQTDIDKLTDWLRSQGFLVTYTAHGRNWIAFDGTAAQVALAFRTEIHRYGAGSQTHYANSTDPSIPAALRDVVAGIRGLSDFHPKPLHRLSPSSLPATAKPRYTDPSGNHYLAPDDIATIYDVSPIYNSGYDGTGLKLMVMGQTDVSLTDIIAFRTLFNLPTKTPTTILVPFSQDPGQNPNDLAEADLDLEWTGAVARNAQIIYVYSTDVFTSAQYAIDQVPILAPVMSFSYGGCEPINLSFLDMDRALAQQGATEGITWVASSGDSGAAGCDTGFPRTATRGLAVNDPASIPEVVAVGGTEFNEGSGIYWNQFNSSTYSSARSYIPEKAWNDTSIDGALAAGGGGISIYYPRPAWQTGVGFPSGSFRLVPDVSITASADHDGYMICMQGSCPQQIYLIGGTSASAPVFSGILTLLNQYEVATGAQPHYGLGDIHSNLYALAKSTPSAFHDVTVGDIIVPCQISTPNCTTGSFGYKAGLGYDMATGLGSVDAHNLLTSWVPPTPYTISGKVTLSSANLSGVTISLSGSAVRSATTDVSGNYNFSVAAGTYTVTPSQAGYSFSPSKTTFTNLAASQTANFAAQCAYTLSSTAPYVDSTSQIAPAITVTTGPACGWSATGGGFITIASGASGTGNGTVTFSVTANTSGVVRTGTLTVAGQTVTLTQRATVDIFADVAPPDYYFDFVDLMSQAGITSGCSTQPLDYCPSSTTTRGQMAVFLIVAIEHGNSFSYSTTPYFTDVPPSHPFFKFVQKLRDLGITSGCSPTTFCPDSAVTRGQMAVFVILSRYGGAPWTYPTTPYFSDVSPSDPFFPFIQKMAQAGITSGCGGGLFCPNVSLNRGQMAVFIVTGLLNELLPGASPLIASATPNTATPGQTLTVTLTGVNTHFVQGVTQIAVPAGIAASNITVLSETSLTVQLAVGAGVAANPLSIVATTGTEEAVLPNGFTVQ